MGWRRDWASIIAASHASIRDAGPRYSPGEDPQAPNLPITRLFSTLEAIGQTTEFRGMVKASADRLKDAWNGLELADRQMFQRRIRVPLRLAADLEEMYRLPPSEFPSAARRAKRDAASLRDASDARAAELQELRFALPKDNHRESERLDAHRREWQTLASELDTVVKLMESEGVLSPNRPWLCIRGSWGTGKTHLLCDATVRFAASRSPVLLILAHTLARDRPPLDAIALLSGVGSDGDDLLDRLDLIGKRAGRPSILVVDAVNEGDREQWRRHLPSIVKRIAARPNVRFVVSCRRPFDEMVIERAARQRAVSLELYGFEDQEFDAQITFFAFYGLRLPPIPMRAPEFSRPLVLKLLCKSLVQMSRGSQAHLLTGLTSGQKALTTVLEHFARELGRPIERDFGLPSKSCWLLLKGARTNTGLAGRMAALGRDWLTETEAVHSLVEEASLDVSTAESLLRRLQTDGLLVDEARSHDDGWFPVVRFAYQRIADHLIARHLLDTHLDVSSEQALRRCLYLNRPLGRIFGIDLSGSSYEEPGLATALMLEIPERIKRKPWAQELLFLLPVRCRALHPVAASFLEGLPWRGNDSFSSSTDSILTSLLWKNGRATQRATFEALMSSAARPNSRYNAEWLWNQLVPLSMSERDTQWTEFVRTTDDHESVKRLIAWVERSDNSRASAEWALNEMRLLALLLTSTDRTLRDRATRAIWTRGREHPQALAELLHSALSFSDPYVFERVLAAAYGVAMVATSHSPNPRWLPFLASIARLLAREIFSPNGSYRTTHTLVREYARGFIAIARARVPNGVATQFIHHLNGGDYPSSFPDPATIDERSVRDADRSMHTDFANYTLGTLIPDRGNYHWEHPEYKRVRKQIAWRIKQLGYSSDLFGDADRSIARYGEGARDGRKVDRYGKKYSWIAYFEMYGERYDRRLLGERYNSGRSADCDIDPSFPTAPPVWAAPLPDVFKSAPHGPIAWLDDGPIPDYSNLLLTADVGAEPGPWTLLRASVLQFGSRGREMRTEIRCVLVPRVSADRLMRQVEQSHGELDHDGRSGADFYTYAGEIPWSPMFATDHRGAHGRPKRDRVSVFGRWRNGKDVGGVTVEIPTYRWSWEPHHSTLNQVPGTEVPAVALCDALRLRRDGLSFDFADKDGTPAATFRTLTGGDPWRDSDFLYLRTSLLDEYLGATDQLLVWFIAGERSVHFDWRTGLGPRMQSAFQRRRNAFNLIAWRDPMSPAHGQRPDCQLMRPASPQLQATASSFCQRTV